MAELHMDATITPSKDALIEAWMGGQRWYAAKGSRPQVRHLYSFRFDDPEGVVGIETRVVADASGPREVVYQVPLTYRGAPAASLDHALVGVTEHSVLGTRWVYDGCHDPAYATQLLAVIQGRARVASSRESNAHDDGVVGRRHPSWRADVALREARVLRGEQSNTSVIMDCITDDGASKPLICKVFRILQAGANPDVEVQGALRAAGSDRVPAVAGQLSGEWTTRDGDDFAGDLVFAQEFLPGVEDAWRIAVRSVEAGTDFATQAGELGAVTAEVHRTLAESMETRETTPDTIHRVIAEMRSRHASATSEAPGLTAYDRQVAAVFAAAEQVHWPPMQRVHGDYHLGQVLRSPQRGWVLLDFEGEPLRPLAERRRPDQWVRDVAGMLRSFDYAGGSHEQAHDGASARPWVEACRTAFLDGYADESGTDPRSLGALLTAFELDKALYEVVYEARNRPTWLSIPLDAVHRLLTRAVPAPTGTHRAPAPSQEVTP